MNTGGLSGGSPPDAARASLSTFWDITAFQHAVAAPLRCPFPVIAAVHGMTLGVGVDMITACDIRYAAEGSQFSIKVFHAVN
jgi:delta(3,5)-delta(2,4)-dienoyl-CoA isomerase